MSDSKSDRSPVLRAAAARKHHDAVQRAARAIRQLVKEARPVTFKAVAEHAPCSTAFLYGHGRAQATNHAPPRAAPARGRPGPASRP